MTAGCERVGRSGRLVRSRARHWKCRRPVRVSRVQISPAPPVRARSRLNGRADGRVCEHFAVRQVVNPKRPGKQDVAAAGSAHLRLALPLDLLYSRLTNLIVETGLGPLVGVEDEQQLAALDTFGRLQPELSGCGEESGSFGEALGERLQGVLDRLLYHLNDLGWVGISAEASPQPVAQDPTPDLRQRAAEVLQPGHDGPFEGLHESHVQQHRTVTHVREGAEAHASPRPEFPPSVWFRVCNHGGDQHELLSRCASGEIAGPVDDAGERNLSRGLDQGERKIPVDLHRIVWEQWCARRKVPGALWEFEYLALAEARTALRRQLATLSRYRLPTRALPGTLK